MLRTENLQIRRGQKVVLSGITLEVRPGEVLGVLGPNGAGKSTLLAGLCAELAPTEGDVWLDQRPLSRWKGVERAQRLAVLPQTSTLDFAFRVEDVVGMGRLPHQTGRTRDAEIVQEALHAADVEHLAGRSYLALSGVSVSVSTLPACWRNYGRGRVGKHCCWMSRPPCWTRCISTPR